MTDDAIDHELERMAGNPRVTAVIKQHLQRLSRGAGGAELTEMARDLLAGRISLREVGRSDVYAQQFIAATDRFQTWYAKLSPEERENLNRTAREDFDDSES